MKSWPDQGGKPSCLAYIVVLILVAIVVIVVIWLLGPAVGTTFSNIGGPL
jgi:Flp pilus assembly pilin Flp